MERFELVAGTSAKFWQVEAKGAELIVEFGRLGTAGQRSSKRLASPALAQQARDKLIAEKVKKGYARVGATSHGAKPANKPAAGSVARKAGNKADAKPTALALAAAWNRKLPPELTEFLRSKDLETLSKRKVGIAYGSGFDARLVFHHAAFANLGAWMERVGLGNDVDYQTDPRVEVRQSLPIAVVESSRRPKSELLAVRLDKSGLPCFFVVGGASFFPQWDSLKELIDEIRHGRLDAAGQLGEAIDAHDKLVKRRAYNEAADMLAAAVTKLEAKIKARPDGGGYILPNAQYRIGAARQEAGDYDAAERHYRACDSFAAHKKLKELPALRAAAKKQAAKSRVPR
jgi:predicted DNA-binding WGR domain protein